MGWRSGFMPALSCPAGTSSILAGAALAAVQRAAGRAVGAEALVHAVLHLEQVLTTGRGGAPGQNGAHQQQGLPWTCRAPTSALGRTVIKSCLLIPLTPSLVAFRMKYFYLKGLDVETYC